MTITRSFITRALSHPDFPAFTPAEAGTRFSINHLDVAYVP